jgi:CTP synthase
LPPDAKKKIAIHCNLEGDAVINAIDVETIYEVPLALNAEGLDLQIINKLYLSARDADIEGWKDIVRKIKEPKNEVNIAIVGKYVGLKDSYKSLIEALTHGGIANDCRVNLQWIDSEEVEVHGADKYLSEADGILVPGGFGYRGIEGKIDSIKYAREKKIPYFGICLGMQCAVIEFARNVCGLKANSSEFDLNTSSPVIYLMEKWFDFRKGRIEERNETAQKGGTMRLGAYPCIIEKNTKASAAYNRKEISERHRHRYEFNNAYKGSISRNGMKISGASPDGELVEIVEIEGHPWFLGCQFHPEFKSRPLEPHPLFKAFIGASLSEKRSLFPHIETGAKERSLD